MKEQPGKSAPSRDGDDAELPLPESLLEMPSGGRTDDSADADSLLASLADEQIDQLAAEEEAAGEGPVAEEAETGDVELTPQEVAALRAEDDAAEAPITPDSPESDTVTSMPTDEELDALLRGDEPAARDTASEKEAESEALLSEAAAELAAELDSQPEKAAAVHRGPPAAPEADEDEADLDTLNADEAIEARVAINEGEPDPNATAVEEEASSTPPAEAVPWFFKPLVWLNAPLARAPEPVRDMIGKVALITILNATAVFVYVFVVRR